MKLSVFTAVLSTLPFTQAMDWLHQNGVQTVELGCGGAPGKAHCDPAVLLTEPARLQDFRETLQKADIGIAALSCHGNPVHPDPVVAGCYHDDFVNAILLAEKLGVRRVVGFSGCPGGAPTDRTPNWVTCAWPEEYQAILRYQWEDVLIPYWKAMAAFAMAHGVTSLALEMHPGFCVYNPETLLRLREAVGSILCANFDPSHLFWQGIDPVAAIHALGSAIGFVHAKDTYLNPYLCAVNGVLDTHPMEDPANRRWLFRTVGYGHGLTVWNDLMSALRTAGYDDVISIEHEDALMTPEEGLRKAIAFMRQAMLCELPPLLRRPAAIPSERYDV